MATTKLMTVEEFATLPDDGWRYELIGGVLQRMPPGGVEHGGIELTLGSHLREFVRSRGLGWVGSETGFIFAGDPPTLRVPDVSFIRVERLPAPEEWANYSDVVPDLAVEVVSPNDEPAEIAAKVAFYLAHGVPLVWVVYPRPPRVEVHQRGHESKTLEIADILDGGDILSGFRLPVARIFD